MRSSVPIARRLSWSLLAISALACSPPAGMAEGKGIFMLAEEHIARPRIVYGPATVQYAPKGFHELSDVVHYYLRLGPDSLADITVTFESTEPYRDTNYLVQTPEDGIEASGNILYASFLSPKDTSVADSGYVHLTSPASDSLVGYYRLYMGGNGLDAPSNPSRIVSGRIAIAATKH